MPLASRRELLCFVCGVLLYGTVTQIHGVRTLLAATEGGGGSRHAGTREEDFLLSVLYDERRGVRSSRAATARRTQLEQLPQSPAAVATSAAIARVQAEAAALRRRQAILAESLQLRQTAERSFKRNQVKFQQQQQRRQQQPQPQSAAVIKSPGRRTRAGIWSRGNLTLPTPIFLLSLPKSGTTSTHKFFSCGLADRRASANHWIENATGYKKRIGHCMHGNVQRGRNLIDGCGDYKVYTDAGAVWSMRAPDGGVDAGCYYPSIHGLEAIYRDYPTATIMIIHRNSTDWAKSIFTWNNLAGRLGSCEGFPKTPLSPKEHTYEHLHAWIDFYDRHTENVRRFAREHPSLTFVEAALEPDETAQSLQRQTGIDADCWKKCKPESGCVETDRHGNEIEPKAVKPGRIRRQEFAPFAPGGALYARPSLKVGTPVYVLSLPRSMSLRIYQYFRCGLRRLEDDAADGVRFRTIRVQDDEQDESYEIEIGQKMWQNEMEGLPMLTSFGNATVLVDMGAFWESDGEKNCFFPSLHGLDALYNSTPSATFVLFTRDGQDWAADVHANNNLMGRIGSVCDVYGFPESPFFPAQRTERDLEKWANFYDAHTELVRSFAAEHPSLTYIEVNVDQMDGARLEQQFGLPAACW